MTPFRRHHSPPHVERDFSEHDDLNVRELSELCLEMRLACLNLFGRRLVVRRRTSHRRGDIRIPSRARPSSIDCDVGMLANPCLCIAAIRKSPEPPPPSPVKTRPVRFAPCAAGARPESTRARPGRRTPEPVSPSTCRFGMPRVSRAQCPHSTDRSSPARVARDDVVMNLAE